MGTSKLTAEVVRPSELGASELAIWRDMQAQHPPLHRAFFTPAFALACERASGRAFVAVLHDGSGIQGFLPFQFSSVWHQRLRLAERIGGGLSDAAGVIARPGFQTTSASLMKSAGLASMSLSHLMDGQQQFGLDADWSQIGHVTDLPADTDSYFAHLLQRDRGFVRDTERCLRRAAKDHGELNLIVASPVPPDLITEVVEQKRLQYARTQVGDPFDNAENLRLLAALNQAPVDECRLVLHRLVAGSRVLAQHLGPRCHDVLSYWFPVYDPAARSLSPGRLLIWRILQQAATEGIRLIDYGEGDALYKREFATGSMPYGRAGWSSGGARSLLANAWQSLEWRRQRRLRRAGNEIVEQNQ